MADPTQAIAELAKEGVSNKDLVTYALFAIVGAFARNFGSALVSLPKLEADVLKLQADKVAEATEEKMVIKALFRQLDQVKHVLTELCTVAKSAGWAIDKPDWRDPGDQK